MPSPEPSPEPSPMPSPAPVEYCVESLVPDDTTTDIEALEMPIEQFDPSLGTLEEVDVREVKGTVKSRVSFENLDATPQIITVSITGRIFIALGDGSGWSTDEQLYTPSNSVGVEAYDGAIDLAGPSSGTLPVEETQDLVYDLDDIVPANFVGTGTINFLLTALTDSSVQGAANILTQINSSAGGFVQVCYTYKPN